MNKTRVSLGLCVISHLLLSACSLINNKNNNMNAQYSEQSFPLYNNEIPGSIKTENQERIKHKKNNNILLEKISLPTLTAYLPQSETKRTAIIICPGGGYGAWSQINEGTEVAERLAKLGIAAFILKYRLPSDETMLDKSTGPLQDIQQAIHIVRQNAQQWQLKEDKIGLMGFSAGGHLAASASVHYQNPILKELAKENLRPDFQILIYPVISFTDEITHKGSRRNLIGTNLPQDKIEHFSNEKQVTPQTPPAFIMHATDDKAVPVENALTYHQALSTNNVDSQLLILPKGGHGFAMRHPYDWFSNMMMWLEVNKLL